jgi:2-keto-4-pentenoate hydratase/2-oxohepta-3-ene-1,7-dioic acid hydratase in catechol pathway
MVRPRKSLAVPFQKFTISYSLGLSDQIFNVRQTIAFLSQGTTLEPGSIILTGTPKGVGYVKNPPIYLQDGDKVNVWLGHGIGTLVNDVEEEKSSDSVPCKL